MADALTEIDLDILQDAIEADIAAAFPSFANVEFYSETRKGMPLPSCLLELSDFEDFNDPDPATGQQAVMARFEARFIISGVKTKTAKRSIRKLAASFAAWLRLRRWTNPSNPAKKLPTGPAQFLAAEPDPFHPEADQYECWRVEWQQVLHLGETVWKPQPGDEITTTPNDPQAKPNIGGEAAGAAGALGRV